MLKAKHGFSFVVAAVSVLLLVACRDDDSDFATRPSEGSSSSVCEDCDESSSSSESVILSGDSHEGSSSSSTKSSSSGAKSSSSSVTPQSSDSETSVSSSSSVTGRTSCDVNTDKNCFMDSRDGQTYKTVTIGSQTWMAENLNYETANSYCYNDNASYCSKYGRLYTWAAAMDSVGTWSKNGKGCGYGTTCSPTYPVRGICPEGWHLPTEAEFETLFTAVGGKLTAGKVLKSTTGWTTYSGITNEDAFAFSALPAGGRYGNGGYYSEGDNAYFWSSTELDSDDAYIMLLNYSDGGAYLGYNFKYCGFSVRCLKD